MARILLMDDEAQARAELRDALVALGHEVSEVSGGRDGCLLAEQEHFDCAVVDIFMPGIDGLDTVQILKSVRPQLPVVVIAGDGHISPHLACRLALALGADHALCRPAVAQVLDAVRACCARTPPPRSQFRSSLLWIA